MRINGQGYVCKRCRKELMSDDVTYYGSEGTSILTNCCKGKVVKKNWIDKLKDKLWKK